MKNKFLVLLVAAMTTLVSCGDKKDEKKEEVVKNVNEFFRVEDEALASKTDDFAMYFS